MCVIHFATYTNNHSDLTAENNKKGIVDCDIPFHKSYVSYGIYMDYK